MTERVIVAAFVNANVRSFVRGISRRNTKALKKFAQELDESAKAGALSDFMGEQKRWTPARAKVLKVRTHSQ